jgi:hypothetical protein
MEPEGLLPHSQLPATCLYPKPAQSSPNFQILKIRLNIVILSTPGSPHYYYYYYYYYYLFLFLLLLLLVVVVVVVVVFSLALQPSAS